MMATLIPEPEASDSEAPDYSPNHSIRSTRLIPGSLVREQGLLEPAINFGAETVTGTSTCGGPESVTPRLESIRIASPLIRLPPGTLPKASVRVVQQWEGVVTQVWEDSFIAELKDLTAPSQPLEVVELPIEEVEGDEPLLVEGAVFYWSIGYETSAGGQVRRMSEIRMRRTPRWTRRDLAQVMKHAEELFERFSP